jgi:hypothetical protein
VAQINPFISFASNIPWDPAMYRRLKAIVDNRDHGIGE